MMKTDTIDMYIFLFAKFLNRQGNICIITNINMDQLQNYT